MHKSLLAMPIKKKSRATKRAAPVGAQDAERLARKIRAALSPDLLKPAYRRSAAGRPATYGHCYAASEAAYHLLGGKRAGWTPQSIQHEGGPHWFLRHRTGQVLDLTADQFLTPVPHDRAVGKGFLTRSPSRRARLIMQRVRAAAEAPFR